MFNELHKVLRTGIRAESPVQQKLNLWPIRFLLVSEKRWALDAILSLVQNNPMKAEREIIPTGLSGMLLYRLWQHGLYECDSWDKNEKCKKVASRKSKAEGRRSKVDSRGYEESWRVDSVPEIERLLTLNSPLLIKVITSLERQRHTDIARIAQRNLAMQELDQWVTNWNENHFGADVDQWIKPIVIKGGATSKIYYPDKSLRLSCDVDVVMPQEMLVDLAENSINWNTHDCAMRSFFNITVEGHQRALHHVQSLDYDKLRLSAQKLSNYQSLYTVNDSMACFITVNHAIKHFGLLCFDLIDLSFMPNVNEATLEIFAENHKTDLLYAIDELMTPLCDTWGDEQFSQYKTRRSTKLAKAMFTDLDIAKIPKIIKSFYVVSLIKKRSLLNIFVLHSEYTKNKCSFTTNRFLLFVLGLTYIPILVFLKLLGRRWRK